MYRTASALVTAMVLVGTLAFVPMTGMAAASNTSIDTTVATDATVPNETNASENASISAGEGLSTVLQVQESELEGEVESRTFGLRVARAASSDAKAEVVAERLNDSRERLERLEAQRAELREAYENGSISHSEYLTETTQLAAEANNVERMVAQSNETSSQLPADVRDTHGINATAVERLSNDASDLTGGEVAVIAQRIAGVDMGENARDEHAKNEGRNQETPTREQGTSHDDSHRNATTTTEDGQDDAPTGDSGDGGAGSNR